jgi:hypothetical protein
MNTEISGSRHVGTVEDRAALGQVISQYFGFPCHSFIPLIPSQSSPSIIYHPGLLQYANK